MSQQPNRSTAASFEPLPKPSSGIALRRVQVKRDWLRVRDAPSRDANVLVELPGGTELIVLEERADWLRIARPTGWVSAEFVRDAGQG